MATLSSSARARTCSLESVGPSIAAQRVRLLLDLQHDYEVRSTMGAGACKHPGPHCECSCRSLRYPSQANTRHKRRAEVIHFCSSFPHRCRLHIRSRSSPPGMNMNSAMWRVRAPSPGGLVAVSMTSLPRPVPCRPAPARTLRRSDARPARSAQTYDSGREPSPHRESAGPFRHPRRHVRYGPAALRARRSRPAPPSRPGHHSISELHLVPPRS